MKSVLYALILSMLSLITACTNSTITENPSSIQNPTFTVPLATKTYTSSPEPSATSGLRALPTLSSTPTLVISATPTASFTATPTFDPATWRTLPVIPYPDRRLLEIYQLGQKLENNPHAFSKVGDCGSTPAWFLGDFDHSPQTYNLGDYQYLQSVIREFNGSFSRTSLAARAGFNASSIFAPIWADPSQCKPNESPLACEYRINKPSFAFIMLGTNDVWHKDQFEPQMRKIIEYSINNGVIPILSTKADNDEGDGSINATIARLAMEYGIPLLNYWAAVQPLPDHGLQPDRAHITWGPNRFNDPQVMKKGWPVRNLTALQTLDVVWRSVTQDGAE